jgi:plastocyanin
MPRYLVVLISAAAMAVAVAACGGSSSTSSSANAAATSSATSSAPAASSTSSSAPTTSGGGSSHLTIAADPSGGLKFTAKSLTAKAGKVTITFTNKAPEGHNFTLETMADKKIAATPTFNGGSRTISVDLKPGKYMYECTVPGHAMGGMMGTLTVS